MTDPMPPTPILLNREAHRLSRANISDAALKVLYRLIRSDYDAYLVGGGVRDLLLGIEPKDFDVVTNARPEEIHGLFRNSRLIGRRFRLAHVRYGREIVEVSTFRSLAAPTEPEDVDLEEDDFDDPGEGAPTRAREDSVTTSTGMILRDNVYGTIDEDAFRRDFTVNALYYTPRDFSITDYTGGLEDLALRRLRLIGDPALRYREDPVRMLRAIRLAAKLEFEIDGPSAAPFGELAPLLAQVPPARLFDELSKLLLGGFAFRAWHLLRESPLFEVLLPATAESIDSAGDALILAAMVNTDRRIADERPVTPGFLYAVLLWPAVRRMVARIADDTAQGAEALLADAGAVVCERQNARTTVPRRFAQFARETWEMQPRLEHIVPSRIGRIVEHPRFRAAWDLLELRSMAGECPRETVLWWEEFQRADEDERARMRANIPRDESARRPARRRRKRSTG